MGLTWTHTGSGISGPIAALAASPLTSGLFYAGTSQGLYKSSDGGATWTRTGTFTSVRAVCIDESNDSVVFAGTSGGVYYTTDGGSSWQQLNEGLTNTDILSLALQSGPAGLLFAGTNGAGAFSQLPPTAISYFEPTRPAADWRLRLVPNPCRGRLTITIETAGQQSSLHSCSGTTSGAIYDKLGRQLWQLAPQPLVSGRATWEIDLSAVPAGVYFLKLEARNRTFTTRIVALE